MIAFNGRARSRVHSAKQSTFCHGSGALHPLISTTPPEVKSDSATPVSNCFLASSSRARGGDVSEHGRLVHLRKKGFFPRAKRVAAARPPFESRKVAAASSKP